VRLIAIGMKGLQLRALVAQIKSKGWVFVGAGNAYRDDLSFSLALEEGLDKFQQGAFDSRCGVRNFGIDAHLATQVDLFIDQVVSSVQPRARAGDVESDVVKS